MADEDPRQRLVLVVLGVLCAGMLAIVIWTAREVLGGGRPGSTLAARVAASPGIWDTHPDPDVARTLQPNLDGRRDKYDQRISSNLHGVRERAYAMPKPAGTTRVVLLGDSMVFGLGVAAEERMGAALEDMLAERATPSGPLEVLHIGLGSWNILAECAFLRRQLSELQPDLVVHVIVNNDLGDSVSARGFGEPATFSRQHPGRADALVYDKWPRRHLGTQRKGYLTYALDWESQERYRRAGDAIERLAHAVEAGGGRYLLLSSWTNRLDLSREWFASRLAPDAAAYVPRVFTENRDNWIRPDDGHWNPAAQRTLARLLYGLIAERGLLAGLDVPAWAEASRVVDEIDGAGRVEAARQLDVRGRARPLPIAAAVDFGALDDDSAAQIHGGVDADGDISPYASMILAHDVPGDGLPRVLQVDGLHFDRPELAGGRVTVLLDDVTVAEEALGTGAAMTLTLPVPEQLAGRPFLTLRFQADDWVYKGKALRRCVSLRLHRVSLQRADDA